MKQLSFQGASRYTQIKEFGIHGLTKMRLTQFKCEHFKYREVLIADVFCGSGSNFVEEKIIDGSPISILDGVKDACNRNVIHNYWFSDIQAGSCDSLRRRIKIRFGLDIDPKCMTAVNAINEIGEYLVKHPRTFLYLVLDPNGPKDFPKYEVQDLISKFGKRVDVIPYISANALNRQLYARNKAGYQLRSWIADIENFDSGFVKSIAADGRSGYIRKPIPGDPNRWTMIPTFGIFHPRNAWEKQGYVYINSDDGRRAIKFYCGGL